ncbi:hypothetical protein D3C87_1468290 [compost metagenome]
MGLNGKYSIIKIRFIELIGFLMALQPQLLYFFYRIKIQAIVICFQVNFTSRL